MEIPGLIKTLVDAGKEVITRVIPDKVEADKARHEYELQILKLNHDGKLEELKTSISAIISESNSGDKWTSRARPSFLYVIYIMILTSLPMGVLYAINPSAGHAIGTGMQEWLGAIPKYLWELFGIGYLGYCGGRTFEKVKGKISL